MSLTGLPVLLVLAAAAAGICGATGWVWQRCTGVAALVVRSVMLLLVMASGAVLAADIANRRYGFYTSFAELTGGTGSATAAAPSLGGSLDAATTARGRRLAQAGHGTVVWLQLNGTRSHTRRTGLVYLPAAYFTSAGTSLRFSVIELFHGNPGGPGNWTHQMHLAATLDAEIAAGRMPPVIAVAPSYTRTVGGECVNARGSADDTYLGVDIPVLLASSLRVRTDVASWATMGYSTGANCAVGVAAHHPGTYTAAASLAGDYPSRRGHGHASAGADLIAAPRFVPPRWPALYLMTSRQDRASLAGVRALAHAASASTPVTTVLLPAGGHNWRVWSAASIPAFDWLAARLPAPLAAPATDPFTVTTRPAAAMGTGRLPTGPRAARRLLPVTSTCCAADAAATAATQLPALRSAGHRGTGRRSALRAVPTG